MIADDYIAETLPDCEALARRLLHERGIHLEALMIGRADVVDTVARARAHGEALADAEMGGRRTCRVCGCTATTACLTSVAGGEPEPCAWVSGDLCSACAPYVEGGK